uniref:Dihydrolipoyl dehydrogenase n=1 Tax=Strombidium inclinatum TaxID=197538 RepID=A0A7S3IFF4_9SPIT|mmetsp:Transcript_1387/g.1831  ORF Transcript_1387/g.1831 Transcript_1387/m.1831 type:complete len:497 (+) Transcript_1387:84-1574(+)
MLNKSMTRVNAAFVNSVLSRSLATRGFAVKEYDLAVIGGGPGGYVAAIKAGQKGLKTVCIEGRGALGGTCLNVGCIPSKALLNTTHKLHEAQHDFKKYGISVDNVGIDFNKMMENKDNIVGGLTSGIEYLLKKNKVDYIKGWGSFTDANTIDVNLNDGGSDQLKVKNTIIATGSDAAHLPKGVLDIDEEYVITSTGALSLKEIPKKMVVVGGGVIGLEMGSVYNRLGCEVTVLQHTDVVCPFLDRQIANSFQKILQKQGLKILTNSRLIDGVNNKENGVSINIETPKGQQTLETDVVLLSIGRKPHTVGLNLEKAGLATNDWGQVEVNHFCQTKVPHIYAIGDVAPGAMLAHKAEEEGVCAVEHMVDGSGHVNYDAIPGVIYTNPEVANVGKSEEELKAAGIEYNVGTFPFMANSRARANMDTDGMVKILACKKTDKLLGAWILGANAGELIHELVLAMEYGGASEDVSRACHAHPTLSEAVKEACLAAHFKPIHF